MSKFDAVVSLGYNCEISFRIEDYFGKLESWPFSWTYVLDKERFLKYFDDLHTIFNKSVSYCTDPRVNSMIQCDESLICFHYRAEFEENDGSVSEAIFPKAVEELRSRISHLMDKFEGLLNDKNRRTLFIVGLTDNGTMKDADFLAALNELLQKKCANKEYVLVAAVPRERWSKELTSLESENVKIRQIRSFGTQRCNDISTDMFGWGKIFGEFLGPKVPIAFYYRLSRRRIKRVWGAIIKRIRRIVE